ncbi:MULTISPECIES: hypothetical protein [unclassified Azospirillum]|uniref:hypothetical protein n=1 Tax=unclassified Azospirillum TaxID=2630922 RepID=UPI000D686F6A|nr:MULTISPECIES: hypothetical protein [unclassified Azospirillum]
MPDVFACLWAELENNIQKVVGHAWGHQRPAEVDRFVELLLNAPDGRLPPLMETYLKGTEPFDRKIRFTVPPKPWLRRAFVVAQSIDLAFETIRPKATPAGGLLKASKGLGAFNRQQRQHGSYGRNPGALGHVIPRGPLRLDRGKVGGNGDNLEQEFPHLTVVRPGALGPAYRLNVRVLPRRMSADAPDDTRVGFVPLAEQADDLHFQAITPSEGGAFLDVVPTDETALAERALKALAELDAQGAHIAVFPELCVGPTTRRLIREGLRRKPAGSLSLILLGSGISEEPAEEDRFYNECTALNGRGDVLWQQRKMNGYAMDCGRLTGCGIDHTATGMDHREWTWSGNVLEVVETEAGRRLMVLICEDLEQDMPSRAACRLTRPDWVFTPVLDASLRVGRWTHKRGWIWRTSSLIAWSSPTARSCTLAPGRRMPSWMLTAASACASTAPSRAASTSPRSPCQAHRP